MESLILQCRPIPSLTQLPSTQQPPSAATPLKCNTPALISPLILKRVLKAPDSHLKKLCRKGRISDAISVLDAIAQHGSKVKPDTFTQLLQSCIDSNSIHLGRKLHAQVGFLMDQDPFVDTKLVSMYAKCGYLEDARNVFDRMSERNLYTWSAMIGAYSRAQRWREVVTLFFMMMEDGIVPDDFIFPKILQASGNCGNFEAVRLMHSRVIKNGMCSVIRVINSVLVAYSKCGSLNFARNVFEKMDVRDIVSWNAIISGYCQTGDLEEAHKLFGAMSDDGIEPGLVTWNILIASYSQLGQCDIALEMMNDMRNYGVTPDVFTWTSLISGFAHNKRRNHALDLFCEMLLGGIEPTGITLTSALSVCASCKALEFGMALHNVVVKVDTVADTLVGNALVNMYAKCGDFKAAWQVFDMIAEKDAYTWNSLIGGYCESGYCTEAHDLFMKMQESDVPPNAVTWNLMISGFMQNGDDNQAIDLFRKMKKSELVKCNTASWNCLIAGHMRNGQKDEALSIFREMQSSCFKPNPVTILSVLPACANLVAANKVKEIYACILRMNLESDLPVANSLVDTYAKSGNIIYSRKVFDRISLKDTISWNSMIAGYILHRLSNDSLDLLSEMGKVGVMPNKGTFMTSILAYGLAGMVEEGKRVFSKMSEDYQISPGLEHYKAMTDLFGRSGRLEESLKFIEHMVVQPDASIWCTLLTASQIHGNAALAVHAGERLLELEPDSILNSQYWLQKSLWSETCNDSSKLRKIEEQRRIKSGLSWIEVKNKVHTFTTGDQSKPHSDLLYSWVKRIIIKASSQFRDGLAPKKEEKVIHVGEEDEEDAIGVHSEKLACAFALIGSADPTKSIRIVKELKMCRGCHMVIKYISKTYGCKIYLWDSTCLHIISDGHCSCGDYW